MTSTRFARKTLGATIGHELKDSYVEQMLKKIKKNAEKNFKKVEKNKKNVEKSIKNVEKNFKKC